MTGNAVELLFFFAVGALLLYRTWLRFHVDNEAGATDSWGARRGLIPADSPEPAATPTLSLPGGVAHDAWQVPIGDGTGAIFLWSWMVGGDDQAQSSELGLRLGLHMGATTVVQAMLAAGFPHFRIVPRHGFVAPAVDGWNEQEVQLESLEFARDHRLLAAANCDHEMLLQLFDPELIVWYLGLGAAAPVIEYGVGTLIVSARHACGTDADFDTLLAQAQHIAQRVLAEGLLHRPDTAAPTA